MFELHNLDQRHQVNKSLHVFKDLWIPVETTSKERFFYCLHVEELSTRRWKLFCYYNWDQENIHINMSMVLLRIGILSMHAELCRVLTDISVMKNLDHSLWSNKSYSTNMYFSQNKFIYKTLFATSNGMLVEMHTWRLNQKIYFSAKKIPSLTALFQRPLLL